MARSVWWASQSRARLPRGRAHRAHAPPPRFRLAALYQCESRSTLAELERVLRADVVPGVPLDDSQENDNEEWCGRGEAAGFGRYVSCVEAIPAWLPARRLAGGPRLARRSSPAVLRRCLG